MTVLRRGLLALLLTVLSHRLAAQDVTAPTTDLPILGLAGITFQVSDLDNARRDYQGVLGFREAFTLKNATGGIASIFFKVNDDQYVEVVPGLQRGSMNRQVRVSFQSSDLARLHGIYT